jgi:hypothetical protein
MLAEEEMRGMKGQLAALLKVLRLRRELHHGAVTSLAPPTAKELMDYVAYLGVKDLASTERMRYGASADIKSGRFQLRARTRAVKTKDGVRHEYQMAALDRDPENFQASPIAIDPWATHFSVDQSQDKAKDLVPIEFPGVFEPVRPIAPPTPVAWRCIWRVDLTGDCRCRSTSLMGPR